MKHILLTAAIMAMLAFTPTDPLTGRWESKPSVTGAVTGIKFKADNNFEGYVNKKPFVTGTYSLKDDIFSFVDNGCEGLRGTYKIIFFSYADSIRFEPISDSCTRRLEGMKKLVLGRKK